MCHGLLGNKNNFNTVGKRLSKRTGRTVYSLDMVNHGAARWSDVACYEEMAQEVAEAILVLCDGSASVIGHSMGGRVAMHSALTDSTLVSSLIVVDVTPAEERSLSMPSSGGIAGYLKLMNDAEVPSTLKANQIRRYLKEQFADHIPEPAIRDFLLTNLILTHDDNDDRFRWKANVEVLLNDFDKLAVFPQFSGQEYLRDTLFIAGALSPYIDWERDSSRIHQLFPLAKLETIDNARHWVHSDQPSTFIDTCAQFLNGVKRSKSFHPI